MGVCLSALALALAFGVEVASADASGQITEFSSGLNASSEPIGIASGPDGNLWFTDPASTTAIGRITPSGQTTEFSTGLNAGSLPVEIAPGPDGNLWFTDRGSTKAIGRITPSGQITEFSTGLNAGSLPDGIAPGPDGNLWFTDRGSTKAIGRITPSGHDHRVLNRPERGQLSGRDRARGPTETCGSPTRGHPGDRADHPDGSDHRVPPA